MKKLTLLLLVTSTLLLTSCAAITVPLGQEGKYGSITVGYIPPMNLPYGIELPPSLTKK